MHFKYPIIDIDKVHKNLVEQVNEWNEIGYDGKNIEVIAFVYDDFTIRQALERMESAGYAALPILNKRGEYRGTLTEGDLLWALKNICYMDMRQAEARRIMEITRRKDNIPVRVTTSMHELVRRAGNQNFVPVVDDKDTFIGIVTRSSIIKYCQEKLFQED